MVAYACLQLLNTYDSENELFIKKKSENELLRGALISDYLLLSTIVSLTYETFLWKLYVGYRAMLTNGIW